MCATTPDNREDKVHFVFDSTSDIRWRTALHKAHDFAKSDKRIGGDLIFGDDKEPDNSGLQAADFFANIARQAEETIRKGWPK